MRPFLSKGRVLSFSQGKWLQPTTEATKPWRSSRPTEYVHCYAMCSAAHGAAFHFPGCKKFSNVHFPFRISRTLKINTACSNGAISNRFHFSLASKTDYGALEGHTVYYSEPLRFLLSFS